MVRTGKINRAHKQKKRQTKARKRYDVSLSVPGAEMRLPSLPHLKAGWRIVSAILTITFSALIYYLWTSPSYRVITAEVNGLQRLTSHDVNAVLDILDESIFTLNSSELQKKLQEAFPEFSSASVNISLPNKVNVEVVERQPILAWQQDGLTTLVDANGAAFPQRFLNNEIPPVAVQANSSPPQGDDLSEANSLDGFMSVELVSTIMSMHAQSPENIPLSYDDEHGLGWKDPRGWSVFFGDVADMDTKMNVYKAIVEQVTKQNKKPSLISIEYVHNPYYRLEQQ